MLDIKLICQKPDFVKKEVDKKYFKEKKSHFIDEVLKLDKKRKKLLTNREKLQAEVNKLSKTKPDKKTILKLKNNKKEIKEKSAKLKNVEDKLFKAMSFLPNLPDQSVPVGKTEEDNEIVSFWGKKPKFDFKIKDHLELGESLDIIDVRRAVKMSGTRFGLLKNQGAMLELALINWVAEILNKKGFTPVIPPILVKKQTMFGTGFLPAEKQEYYKIPEDNLYLAGTAEVPLATMHINEVLEKEDLPRKYWGFSSCFRREAGSYGKDTRGIFRVHQFDKVEMFIFTHPRNSWQEFENLRKLMETIFQKLDLHYRLVNICTGELGDPNTKKYDLEAWFPGQKKYRELTSCSHDTDFQARRLSIKYRNKDGLLNYVHTINSTAVAIGRTILAILEQNQQKNGRVLIPKVLQPHMDIKVIK
jgi:seryl-tRNA synthetase